MKSPRSLCCAPRLAAPAAIFPILGALAILLAGCGGGSGSDSSLGTVGSAMVLVGDDPPVDIDGFTVTIERVILLGGVDGPIVIFEGEKRVDLLDHQDQEFLLTLCDLPAGTYGISFTTQAQQGFDAPEAVLIPGQILTATIPLAGTLTIYAKP